MSKSSMYAFMAISWAFQTLGHMSILSQNCSYCKRSCYYHRKKQSGPERPIQRPDCQFDCVRRRGTITEWYRPTTIALIRHSSLRMFLHYCTSTNQYRKNRTILTTTISCIQTKQYHLTSMRYTSHLMLPTTEFTSEFTRRTVSRRGKRLSKYVDYRIRAVAEDRHRGEGRNSSYIKKPKKQKTVRLYIITMWEILKHDG